MKRAIAITILIIAATGIPAFAAMGGHGGSGHHGTTDHYGDGHYSDMDYMHRSPGSTDHHYGASGIPSMTNRMGAMMEQMSAAMTHQDMNPDDMEAIGTMMDRLSDNMHTLSQHRNSGTMTDEEMKEMHNEIDNMHKRLNSITSDLEG